MESRKSIIKHDNSSRGQENTFDLVDRISVLPDPVLGLILSYLPTKIAVATTILSKRWEFVWINVHNLDFCYEDFDDTSQDENEDMNFLRFVNRVLLLRDGGLLDKFRLVLKYRFIPSQVSSWISTAIARNVHKIFLCIYGFDVAFEMPTSVFSCDSLQCLELNGDIHVSAAILVSLPRLESLKLVSVYFESEETFQKLISGCPMLSYMYLDLDIRGFTRHFVGQDDVVTYRISSPSLSRLDLYDDFWDLKFTSCLEIEASSLEYLNLNGLIHQVFVQGSLSSLVEADLGIHLQDELHYQDIYNSLAKGVRSLDCAKALILSNDVMWALSNAAISLSTKFKRLTKLKARVVCCYYNLLQEFLQNADSLEVLEVSAIYKHTYDQTEYNHDHSNWTAPVEVPKCLLNSLKEVSYEGYSGGDNDREMLGYLLKHGSALEVMQVACCNGIREGEKLELVDQICRFPRKSQACKINLSSEQR